MTKLGRRGFLKAMSSGALAASIPATIRRALAIPANDRTRSIADVEHIVILTQENRSFDHYFGSLRGVRGFGDPRAVILPSGKNVFHQPNGAGELLPFRPNVQSLGNTFLADVSHGWNDGHAAWNGGQYDQWVPSKGVTSMVYNTRHDLPYHYALADAFTICDGYYCSLMGPTDPNRYHMWTGWVGNDGSGGGPVITNAELGYNWSTFPERMEQAGISWKVYQDTGNGLTADGYWGWTADPYIGNYGDNSLLYFHQYQNAAPGNPLADKAKTGTNVAALNRDPVHLLDVFRADVQSGKLPQVSYIVAPEAFSEHPNWAPNFGAWYISQFLDILVSNPDVFRRTVLFINYDENGGFFDHMVPPTPPQSTGLGSSTVSTDNEIFPGDGPHVSGPYGLGTRVPMLVVSPWSKGGYVNSQVFDHTSVIRFIEKRFGNGLIETNITPWRRAVAGDLTTAFDFENPNASGDVDLPDTSSYKPTNLVRYPDYKLTIPMDQSLPSQEPGVRRARALPYELNAHGMLLPDGSFSISFENTGTAAVVFQVRSSSPLIAPRTYTVEPGKALNDTWALGTLGLSECDLSVYGPNGFFRRFAGNVSSLNKSQVDVRAHYDAHNNGIALVISNPARQPADINILDQYTGLSVKLTVQPGNSESMYFSLHRFSGWYDLMLTLKSEPTLLYHFAGHLETGKASISDPALGGLAGIPEHSADEDNGRPE